MIPAAGWRGPRRFAHGHNARVEPNRTPRPHILMADRLWPRVEERGACRFWTGFVGKTGYGQIRGDHGKNLGTHVAAWILTHGPIPDGLWVLHNCPGGDNRACVRCDGPLTPYWANGAWHECYGHLWLGTAADNNADIDQKGRRVPPPGLKGETNNLARLTEATVRAIRLERAAGATQTALATKYDIDQTTVSMIVHRKTWKHVV
jgi:hypothetical protein